MAKNAPSMPSLHCKDPHFQPGDDNSETCHALRQGEPRQITKGSSNYARGALCFLSEPEEKAGGRTFRNKASRADWGLREAKSCCKMQVHLGHCVMADGKNPARPSSLETP